MYEVKDQELRILLPKEVDHHQSISIREQADNYLMLGKAINVVFDFKNTEFCDSSGIGMLVGRYKKVACFGGKVSAIHVNHHVMKMLKIADLEKMIQIVSEEEEANE